MSEIIQKNVISAELRSSFLDGDITIPIDAVPEHPDENAAYVLSMPNTWEDLGTVPINDEIFETDSNLLKNQLAKMQFGMRIIRLPLQIVTPIIKNQSTAYGNRADLLHDLQKMMANIPKYCELYVTIDIPDMNDYVMYCHPHGVDALRVTKLPYRYDIVLTMVAEDPLFYATPVVKQLNEITNYGDVAYYASITLENPHNFQYLYCTNEDGGNHYMKFRKKITSDEAIEINVRYPGQICTITGAEGQVTLADVEVSNVYEMFLQVPLGTSTWHRNDPGDVIVHTRTPLIGIPP